MTKNPRILIIGSINVDMVTTSERIPSPGETVRGSTFTQYFGGKGANQAVAAARAGAQVSILGAVGDDTLGQQALASLNSYGVDTSFCRSVTHTSTGVASINIDAAGENSITVVSGANEMVRPDDLKQIDWSAYEAVVLQLEIPMDTVQVAIHNAAPFTKIVLTPAPAQILSAELLEKIDILIPNEHEVTLLGHGKDASVAAQSIAAKLRLGIVLTLGSKGALCIQRDGNSLAVPAPEVKNVVDTVGAGDCFSGYLIHGLASNFTPEDAICRACKAASIKITRKGAHEGIPTADEID